MALEVIGVAPETEARIELFTEVPAPTVEAFTDETPVTVPLTAGQVNMLRAELRQLMNTVLATTMQAVAQAALQQREITDFIDVSKSDENFRRILDLEDALMAVWAEVQAADFVVPDTLDELLDSEPADEAPAEDA